MENDGLAAAAAAGPGMHVLVVRWRRPCTRMRRTIDIAVAIVIKQYVLRTTASLPIPFHGSITKPRGRLTPQAERTVLLYRLFGYWPMESVDARPTATAALLHPLTIIALVADASRRKLVLELRCHIVATPMYRVSPKTDLWNILFP